MHGTGEQRIMRMSTPTKPTNNTISGRCDMYTQFANRTCINRIPDGRNQHSQSTSGPSNRDHCACDRHRLRTAVLLYCTVSYKSAGRTKTSRANVRICSGCNCTSPASLAEPVLLARRLIRAAGVDALRLARGALDTVPSMLMTAPDSGQTNGGDTVLNASMPLRVVSVTLLTKNQFGANRLPRSTCLIRTQPA